MIITNKNFVRNFKRKLQYWVFDITLLLIVVRRWFVVVFAQPVDWSGAVIVLICMEDATKHG